MTSPPATGSILVVDDDPLNRTLLARALEVQGHQVLTASNGHEALDILRAHEPDIVLLDIVMPGMDGVSVLERIEGDAALRSVPVIMISALEELDSVVRCIELGADDYLHKPFDPVLLRARIGAGLDKRRLRQLERARVRDAFARFLPEPMVDEVLSRGNGDLRLGGVRVVSTVLFADLRSFTSFAERTAPDRVIAVLNRFFGEMSDAVLDNGGTLVAFLGDGLIAVFGAPIECDDHADRALAAAREMLHERLQRFNGWAGEQGYGDGFRMGIGICSGPLMSGNVGSERRLEYTAIGDTVNTASRIESLTKELGHPLLLSESTLELMTARQRTSSLSMRSRCGGATRRRGSAASPAPGTEPSRQGTGVGLHERLSDRSLYLAAALADGRRMGWSSTSPAYPWRPSERRAPSAHACHWGGAARSCGPLWGAPRTTAGVMRKPEAAPAGPRCGVFLGSMAKAQEL